MAKSQPRNNQSERSLLPCHKIIWPATIVILSIRFVLLQPTCTPLSFNPRLVLFTPTSVQE